MSRLVRAYLLLGGIVAVGLGAMILFAPVSFYAGYGLDLGGQVDLLNELRSHGLGLLGAGLFIASGAFAQRLAQSGLLIATALYLSYGLAHLVAMALDGLPASSLILVCAVEIVFGLIGLVLVLRSRVAPTTA
jgi:hypothetical protein